MGRPNHHKTFTSKSPPEIGTWVTVSQGRLHRSRMRSSNASQAPALVSALSSEGATLLYPNNLVLSFGFKGEPLKRVVDVAFHLMRPFTGTDLSKQIMEKAMAVAVKAGAKSLRRSVSQEDDSSTIPPTADDTSGARERSRSRDEVDIGAQLEVAPAEAVAQSQPARNATSSNVLATADEASGARERSRSRGEVAREAQSEDKELEDVAQNKEQDVVMTPERPASPSQSRHLDRQASAEKPQRALAIIPVPDPVLDVRDKEQKKQMEEFSRRRLTAIVGNSLRATSNGRMLKVELEAALKSKGFTETEIESGLFALDASNKIFLMDDIAFLI